MIKKKYVLTDEALNVLKRPEAKPLLMMFFGIRDRRTINSYLSDNVPSSLLMNIHIKEIVRILSPSIPENCIFRRMTQEEAEALNRAHQNHTDNEQSGESN